MIEPKDEQKPMPNTMFKMMSLTATAFYKLMDLSKQVQKSGVREGQTVLDFGCGSGHFTIACAREMGIPKEAITDDVFHRVKKGVEFGLECWTEVVKTALDEALKG